VELNTLLRLDREAEAIRGTEDEISEVARDPEAGITVHIIMLIEIDVAKKKEKSVTVTNMDGTKT
jgi:hypothetical protein